MMNHLLTKHEFWPFEIRCDQCQRQFCWKPEFAMHWNSLHSKVQEKRPSLTCDECLKVSARKKDLATHWLRIHAGKGEELNRRKRETEAKQPPLICDNCGRSIKRRDHFARHVQSCC